MEIFLAYLLNQFYVHDGDDDDGGDGVHVYYLVDLKMPHRFVFWYDQFLCQL